MSKKNSTQIYCKGQAKFFYFNGCRPRECQTKFLRKLCSYAFINFLCSYVIISRPAIEYDQDFQQNSESAREVDEISTLKDKEDTHKSNFLFTKNYDLSGTG